MAERDLRTAVAGALIACLGAACGPRRPPLPPRVACEGGSRPGLPTRHLAWNGHGWSALVLDGHRLFLRHLQPDGVASGEPVALGDDARDLDTAAITADTPGTTVRAAFVDRGDGAVHVVRVGSGDPSVATLATAVIGGLSLVGRPAVAAAPAAVFAETLRGTEMAVVEEDGALRARTTCPPGVSAAAVVAADDGFFAVNSSAEGVSALWLDEGCRVLATAAVRARASLTHLRALAPDPAGPWMLFTDNAGDAWIAAAGAPGSLRFAPQRLDGFVETPSLVVVPGDRGTRELQVIAMRRTEADTRLVSFRYDASARFVEVRSLLSDPVVSIDAVAPTPWGGALVGYRRAGVGSPGGFSFLYRMCP